MRKFKWKDYLSFSKNERMAVILLACIVVVFSAMTFYFRKPQSDITPVVTMLSIAEDSLDRMEAHAPVPGSHKLAGNHFSTENLFPFDPNSLEEDGFVALGFSAKNARMIVHYRNKGGHFWKPEDIRKIYTLDKNDADKLIPFVRIEKKEQANSGNGHFYPLYEKTEKIFPNQPIDVNLATKEQWKSLPGIGAVLSERIVKYRTAKHGFRSIEEVKKTYGISDSLFESIRPFLIISAPATPLTAVENREEKKSMPDVKVNINTDSEETMRNSRILPTGIIKAIVIYREQHQGFKSVAELRKIPFVSRDTFDKISPYLTVE